MSLTNASALPSVGYDAWMTVLGGAGRGSNPPSLKALATLFTLALGGVACRQADDPCRPALTEADRAAAPARHTPRWAFEPWISKDISDTDDTYAFVDGFAARDIPVGAVVLDSPWETHYNTFVPNPARYHDFDKLVADLHARDIRLVLWITQMVNNYGVDFEAGGDSYVGESPNFAAGQ